MSIYDERDYTQEEREQIKSFNEQVEKLQEQIDEFKDKIDEIKNRPSVEWERMMKDIRENPNKYDVEEYIVIVTTKEGKWLDLPYSQDCGGFANECVDKINSNKFYFDNIEEARAFTQTIDPHRKSRRKRDRDEDNGHRFVSTECYIQASIGGELVVVDK